MRRSGSSRTPTSLPIRSICSPKYAKQVTFVQEPVQSLALTSYRDPHTIDLGLQPAPLSNSNWPVAMPDTPEARPGAIVYGADPEEVWRKGITGNTQDNKDPLCSAGSPWTGSSS